MITIFHILLKITGRAVIVPLIVGIGWLLIKKLRNKSYEEIKKEMIG